MSLAVIKLISTSIKDVDSIAHQIISIAKALNVKNKGPVPLPTKHIIQPTRRTPAADGSHTWEKWEMRVHKRLIEIDGSEQALRQVMRIPVPDTVQIEISLS
ncbi:MAG: 30S ribosomal protein S10 [Candidatus Marsarchaeota archaeon]|nr:30S ribosomal protein S10 [Candidatus Marsarchaeota archaeon]